jgi:hypothetical protein
MFDATALKYVAPEATEIVDDRNTLTPVPNPSEIGVVVEVIKEGLPP